MGKAPCFGDRPLRLSGGYDGLSLIAVCNNKLLDLERKFQAHPQPLLNAATPLFLMPEEMHFFSQQRHSSRKPPPYVFLHPTSLATILHLQLVVSAFLTLLLLT